MICPIILAALIQAKYFFPEDLPNSPLRSPVAVCVERHCGFYNQVLSACGQSHPEAEALTTALPAIEVILDLISDDVGTIVEKTNFS